jgi:hypothetical protein
MTDEIDHLRRHLFGAAAFTAAAAELGLIGSAAARLPRRSSRSAALDWSWRLR